MSSVHATSTGSRRATAPVLVMLKNQHLDDQVLVSVSHCLAFLLLLLAVLIVAKGTDIGNPKVIPFVRKMNG